jgi:predicted TIM-barrel fold metal-dependent hydrolase
MKPFIIDMHTHLGNAGSFYMPDTTPEKMLEVADRCGIEKIIAAHNIGILTHELEFAHEESREIVEKFPGRIYAYSIYDPNLPELSLKILAEYAGHSGFPGIKAHSALHGYPINGKNYEPLWEFAEAVNLPVLIHTWDATPQNVFPFELVDVQQNATPDLVADIAQRHPGLTLILGHAGGHFNGNIQAVEAVSKNKNVFLDICGEATRFGVVEWLVEQAGPEKIMYASDMNWLDPRCHIARVIGSRLNDKDVYMLLRGNAERIFKF